MATAPYIHPSSIKLYSFTFESDPSIGFLVLPTTPDYSGTYEYKFIHAIPFNESQVILYEKTPGNINYRNGYHSGPYGVSVRLQITAPGQTTSPA